MIRISLALLSSFDEISTTLLVDRSILILLNVFYLLYPGLFWVPAGAFNIFAIRNAGIAISQGIVSSSIVTVSGS